MAMENNWHIFNIYNMFSDSKYNKKITIIEENCTIKRRKENL